MKKIKSYVFTNFLLITCLFLATNLAAENKQTGETLLQNSKDIIDLVILPELDSTWQKFNFQDSNSGSLSLPGEAKIIHQNEKGTIKTDFFRGIKMERFVLLLATYGGKPEKKPRATIIATSLRQLNPKSSLENLTEVPIPTSLENTMGAFEESFLPIIKLRKPDLELVSKEIKEINNRKTFLTTYTYQQGNLRYNIKVSLFKSQKRIYILLLEILEDDNEYWEEALGDIISKWETNEDDTFQNENIEQTLPNINTAKSYTIPKLNIGGQ